MPPEVHAACSLAAVSEMTGGGQSKIVETKVCRENEGEGASEQKGKEGEEGEQEIEEGEEGEEGAQGQQGVQGEQGEEEPKPEPPQPKKKEKTALQISELEAKSVISRYHGTYSPANTIVKSVAIDPAWSWAKDAAVKPLSSAIEALDQWLSERPKARTGVLHGLQYLKKDICF